MKWRRWRKPLAWLGLLAGAGLLVAASGVIPIRASSGHWAVTDWLLHFSMRRSVKTHSLGSEPPQALDRVLAIRGAGHYQAGCLACHGAPGIPRSEFTARMTPEPPELDGRIGEWDAGDLFYVVRHGVKYTAMPAWPAPQREDEVWALVSFMLRLPGLSPAEYRAMAWGPAAGGLPPALDGVPARLRERLPDCARCHGFDGTGREGAFPRLDRLSGAYIAESLRRYQSGHRPSGMMQTAVRGLSLADIEALARYYGGLDPAPVVAGGQSEQTVAAGRQIALEGLQGRGVPACRHCHGPEAVADNPYFPRLAGQPADYLAAQLHLWRSGERGGTEYAPLMSRIAHRLADAEIEHLAAYYAAGAPPR